VNRLKIPALALSTLLAAAGGAAAADLWLHVHVDERGAEAATVRVNLPLSMIETVLAVVPDDGDFRGGKVVFSDQELTAADLRRIWQSLKASPDATFVEVEQADQRVKVAKQGGYLLVTTVEPREGGDTVDVKIPEPVVEALLSGEGEELDVAAAVRALAARGEGELVTVDNRDAKVRIWVDGAAESR
jgi:hypothetical protein